MKIIYSFIHDEIAHFSGLSKASRASGIAPAEVKPFYRLVATGNHKFTPDDLSVLTDTYRIYEPYLAADEKVMALSGILSACARSPLDDNNLSDLEFLITTVTQVLILNGWSRIDRDPKFLETACKSMRQVVTAHLPLMSDQALGIYFANSRRFTQFSPREPNNGFRLHSSSDVLEENEIVEADVCSIPNQALMALIFHCCEQDGPVISDSDFAIETLCAQSPISTAGMLEKLATCLKRLGAKDLYIPIKLPDLVAVALLIERFALAASFATAREDQHLLNEGVSSLVDLVLRNRPSELISKDYNMFLADAPGFTFYEKPVAKLLEESLLKSAKLQNPLSGASGQAVQDLYWAVARNCLQVHVKHSNAGYDNQALMAGLVQHCMTRLMVPKSLRGFKPEQQAMLISGVADHELKKRLLTEYKSCRGHVLSSDLGM